MRDSTCAVLIWDGSDEVRLPGELGVPRADQLQGTTLEKLCEVAGRTCYDSFGTGRDSASYHKHLLEVGHLSVHEHATFTVEFKHTDYDTTRHVFMNRPQCWYRLADSQHSRVTLNLRTVLEWDSWSRLLIETSEDVRSDDCGRTGDVLKYVASCLVNAIISQRVYPNECGPVRVVQPETEDEEWVSLFLTGSRGFSHEQVRHGDFSAISQRSTRYVDESDTAWVEHPLLTAWFTDMKAKGYALACDHVTDLVSQTTKKARSAYDTVVDLLQNWLVERGVDKLGARKQARGAARGYLGNALYTEMIFTANVRQWKRMLAQRAAVFADAEIREVYAGKDEMKECVLTALKQSRYAGRFDRYELAPSPDGIGLIARENTAE